MSEEYIKTAFSLKRDTYDRLKNSCPELVPLSRYLNLVLDQALPKKEVKNCD